jgi:hypothetical protein
VSNNGGGYAYRLPPPDGEHFGRFIAVRRGRAAPGRQPALWPALALAAAATAGHPWCPRATSTAFSRWDITPTRLPADGTGDFQRLPTPSASSMLYFDIHAVKAHRSWSPRQRRRLVAWRSDCPHGLHGLRFTR